MQMEITSSRNIPFIVKVEDDKHWNTGTKVIRFYDKRYNQYVAGYYLFTFMDIDGHALILDTGSPDWYLSSEDVKKIQDWIKQLD